MTQYPEDGLYELTPEDIFEECRHFYEDFFSCQTPIKVFQLSIALYHLLEWICPEANTREGLDRIKNKSEERRSAAERLVYELGDDPDYKVIQSLANNSKHHTLRSKSYKKGEVQGFLLHISVLGERFGQRNLTVTVNGEERWLREVFNSVLSRYEHYFNDSAG